MGERACFDQGIREIFIQTGERTDIAQFENLPDRAAVHGQPLNARAQLACSQRFEVGGLAPGSRTKAT
jgi:hypothetical protein